MAKKSKSANPKKDKGFGERVVFLTNRDQHAWLQAQSEATGAPLGHIIRKAVAEYRQRVTRKAKPAPEKPAEPQADIATSF